MASALLENLTAASTLAASDLFYVKQAGARGLKATGTQLLALVGTTYVPLAGGVTMTGLLTVNTGATTTSSLVLTGYLTVGGVTTFEHKGLTATTGLLISSTSGYQIVRAYSFVDTNNAATIGDTGRADLGVSLGSARALMWSSSSGANSAAADIYVYRDAAATLAQRNGTTQQIFRLYNTYTDSSNYERLTLTGVAGTSVNITAESAGTGSPNLDLILTAKGGGIVKTAGAFNVAGNYFNVGAGGDVGWFTTSVVQIRATAGFTWALDSNAGSSPDTGLHRNAAGVVEVNNGTAGTWRDLKLRNLIQTEYSQLTEMTAPSAPATNSVRIYAEDNGSGKTRLMALFATGAAQQISIEP